MWLSCLTGFSAPPGLKPVLWKGAAAPGSGAFAARADGTYSTFTHVGITSGGRVVFGAGIKYPPVPFKPDAVLSLWAIQPEQAPVLKSIASQPTGMAGTVFSLYYRPLIDDTGQIAFRGSIAGGESTFRTDSIVGIIPTAGPFAFPIREGGTPPGNTLKFGDVGIGRQLYVNGGFMAVDAILVPPDSMSGNPAAWSYRQNTLGAILAPGMPAPADPTRKVSFANVAALSANGQVLVSYQTPDGSNPLRALVLQKADGSLVSVVSSLDTLPDSSTAKYTRFSFSSVNRSGQVVVSLPEPYPMVIAGTAGVPLNFLVRSRDLIAGRPNEEFRDASELQINDAGDIVFQGSTGSGKRVSSSAAVLPAPRPLCSPVSRRPALDCPPTRSLRRCSRPTVRTISRSTALARFCLRHA